MHSIVMHISAIAIAFQILVINAQTFCSDSCRHEGGQILEWMNASVDPCEDFYQFTCGGFVAQSRLNHSIPGINTFGLLKLRNMEILTNALEKKPTLIGTFGVADFKSALEAHDFYQSCKREPDQKLNISFSQSLKKQVQRFASSFQIFENSTLENKTENMTKRLAYLHSIGSDVLFSVAVEAQFVNSTFHRSIIRIDMDDLTKSMLTYHLNDSSFKNEYIYNITQHLIFNGPLDSANEQEAQELAGDIFNLQEEWLLLSQMNSTQWQGYTKENNLTYPLNASNFTMQNFSKFIDSFHIIEYFARTFSPKDYPNLLGLETLVMDERNLLFKLDHLIQKTSIRIMNGYMHWANLKYLVAFTSMDTSSNANPSLFTQLDMPKTFLCTTSTLTYFDDVLTAMFSFEAYHQLSSHRISSMISALKIVFRKRIMELEWLDEETRQGAIQKLDAITSKIAFDSIHSLQMKLSHRQLSMHPLDYYDNLVKLRKHQMDIEKQSLLKPIQKKNWITSATAVNAYYSMILNQIYVPVGIMQPPMFDYDFPAYLNYGAMGFIIGHELTHAFDNQGATRDAKGRISNWWTNATKHQFQQESKCIIDQYSNYSMQIGNEILFTNGERTLGENIADNGGLARAYEAWKYFSSMSTDANMRNFDIPGLNYTQEQLFFIAFGQSWCHVPDESLNGMDAYRMKQDVHAHDPIRVNGVVSNSIEFSNAFQCQLGQRMNPIKKCQIW